MFADFITNEKCTNTKYPRPTGLKIIALAYIKINTILSDTVPSR
jgi:hypothetical protein